jgi:putative ABC transport system permease protein
MSVTIAVAIIVSAIGLSRGIRQKLGNELKTYGANVIVSSKNGFNQAEVSASIAGIKSITSVTYQLYGQLYSQLSSQISGQPNIKLSEQLSGLALASGYGIELIGMDMNEASGWPLDGRLPLVGKGEVLVGSNVRQGLSLNVGDIIKTTGGIELKAVGFSERGGLEDKTIMFWLKDAQGLLGRPDVVSAVLVRAVPGKVDIVVTQLKARLPGAEVKSLRQVAGAEESFLKKIELLMALVSVVVLITASISLSSTMSATVLERLKEIGLMMAIGGTRRSIGVFFVLEGAAIGFLGGVMGFIIGALAAMAVSSGAFGSVVIVSPVLLVVGVMLGVLISVVASVMPLAGALRLKPSVILRGE